LWLSAISDFGGFPAGFMSFSFEEKFGKRIWRLVKIGIFVGFLADFDILQRRNGSSEI